MLPPRDTRFQTDPKWRPCLTSKEAASLLFNWSVTKGQEKRAEKEGLETAFMEWVITVWSGQLPQEAGKVVTLSIFEEKGDRHL